MELALLTISCLLVALSSRIDGSAVSILQRFESTEGTCSLLQRDELCFVTVDTWYFDSDDVTGCFNATEEICGGKGNRFQSKEECEEKCLDRSERDYQPRANYDHHHHDHNHHHHPQPQPYPYRPGQISNRNHCWDQCHNRCPGGYDRCDSCACNNHRPPTPICNPVRCPGHCNTEFVQDDNGCTQCNCRQQPCQGHHCGGGGGGDQCSRVHCPIVCPRSTYSHLHHCCNCRNGGLSRPPCNNHCPNHCPNGHIDHPSQGCRNCECKEPVIPEPIYHRPCPIHQCGLGCHNGYKKSPDGCQLCECADQGHFRSLTDCSHLPCRHDCAFGCYVNQATCDARICLPSSRVLHRGQPYRQPGYPCPNIRSTCRLHCPYGHVADGHGCETCQCKDDPRRVACPPAEDCGRYCPHGYNKYRDHNGCDACRCHKWNEDHGDNHDHHDHGP